VCSKNSDCESGLCNGTCLPRGCMNGIKDGSETDVDCGGSCDACDDGAACMVGAHCESKVCTDGFCLAATCEDDVRNAAETDVDCGGDDCETCEDGDSCDTDGDCKSGFCGDGTCADPACGDGSKNGDESDTDCGGSCPPCAADRVCRANSDCASNNCNEETRLCIAATCDDEIANGDESDEDCGGPCQPCPDGSTCNAAADCVSSVCQPPEVQAEADAGVAEVDLLQCAEPTCEDEVRNGSETGIDCGGSSCDPCGLDAPCSTDSDC